MVWCVVLLVIHFSAVWVGARWLPLLAKRPTIVAGHLHCTTTAVVSVGVFAGWIDLAWYYDGVLALSMAHSVMDTFLYSIPNRDYVMLVHHVVLVYCHGAMGSVAGAACAGLTDAGGLPGVEGIRLISLAGYCAEVPNVFLNSRWVMMQTGWATQYPGAYFANNLVVLVLWAGTRIFWYMYIFYAMLLPVYDAYSNNGAGKIWWTIFAGYFAIFVMSTVWMQMMLKKGARSFLVYTPGAVRGLVKSD